MTDREAFEKWYGNHAGWYPVTKAKNHPTLPDGTYLYDSPNNMWDCWQVATKAEKERCAEIVGLYKVPVGNSSAGELACEWTMDAIKEIYKAIRGE
jgi:hypothetical protein